MLEKRDEEDITLVGTGLGSIQLLHLGRPLPVGCRLLWALSYRCLHSEGRLEAGVKELPGVFYDLPAAKPLSVLHVKKDDHFMEGSPSLLTSFLVVFALCPSVAAAPADQVGGERRAVRGELKLPHQWAVGMARAKHRPLHMLGLSLEPA